MAKNDISDKISGHLVNIQNITDNVCTFEICGHLNTRTSIFPDYVKR